MIVKVVQEVFKQDVSCLEDIPEGLLLFFAYQDYKTLIRPLVDIARQRGQTNGQIAITFGVSKGFVEYHFSTHSLLEEEE
jgi:hypothetical protein